MKTTKMIDENWSAYDQKVGQCQLLNYGKIYLDEYGCPIDNEAEVEELCRKDRKEWLKSLKFLEFDGRKIAFLVSEYADMFHRKAVVAWDVDEDDLYAGVTINIPQYSLDDSECFLSADCPLLISEMEKRGLLKVTRKIKVNYGAYQVGVFTEKFKSEFEQEVAE